TDFLNRGPFSAGAATGLGRLASTKRVVHVADLKAEQAYLDRDPLRVATVDGAGARTGLAVPMLKENKLVGAIVIYPQEVRPFTDRQIELEHVPPRLNQGDSRGAKDGRVYRH